MEAEFLCGSCLSFAPRNLGMLKQKDRNYFALEFAKKQGYCFSHTFSSNIDASNTSTGFYSSKSNKLALNYLM
jgi:hypothetical protein